MTFNARPLLRCAIYTRKSSEEGLEQSFNSLHAQREACQAFILSQSQEGWRALPQHYDDGGYSGGNMERPALQQLLTDVAAKKVNTIVVYKVDRLTRSLADFAKIVEALDAQQVSFVSVTQQFNTTNSMGRLTLNVLLSFAQFEREVTGERIRDKIAASKQKGMWMGGNVPVGYDVKERKLVINSGEAIFVRSLFDQYLDLGCVSKLKKVLDEGGATSKVRISAGGKQYGGSSYQRGGLYKILNNPVYLGRIKHKGQIHQGIHEAIVSQDLWNRVHLQLRSDHQGRRTGTRATAPSLLLGLVWDHNGNRFTPSHTVKNGRRYRYYVCQAPTQKTDTLRPTLTRLPAHEIENLVTSHLRTFLQSDSRVMDELASAGEDPHVTQQILIAAQRTATSWEQMAAAALAEFLKRVIHRVEVQESMLLVLLRKRILRQILTGNADAAIKENEERSPDHFFQLQIPTCIKRFGGEVRLVVSPDTLRNESGPPAPLLKAFARAQEWRELLIRGEIHSVEDLASRSGLNARYVRRILQLAFLAPDIVDTVLQNGQPASWTLERLRKKLPPAWDEQRQIVSEWH